MTPFQQRAIDVATKSYHEEQDGVLSGENDVGGIQAAPIVAIIDSYTASEMEVATQRKLKMKSSTKPTQRYATLASVEVVKQKKGEATVVKFMGVGRVLLQNYFSSKDVGLTMEEEELSQLLTRIQEFDDDEEGEPPASSRRRARQPRQDVDDEEDGRAPVRRRRRAADDEY